MSNPTMKGLKFRNEKSECIVFGFIRDALNSDHGHESQSLSSENASFTKIPEGIWHIVVTYYHDKLLLQTNVLYSRWNDLGLICNEEQLANIKEYRRELVQMGYNPNRLPLYELYRYYFGVAQDMNRALNKWKGSVETFTYYNLQDVPLENMRRCFQLLTKSCQFCGYHDMDIGKPSPVFILNYECFDWREFPDMNPLIKAAFYVGSWMTDSLEAMNNGITLLINCQGVSFREIAKAMTLLRAMQKALALRTNNVFFLNLPSLAKSSMKLFLKIYPKHIQDRLHVCSDIQSLYEILTEDQIPQIFGGTLGSDAGGSGKTPCLGELLSAYAEIKDFDHLTLDNVVGFEDYGSRRSGWY